MPRGSEARSFRYQPRSREDLRERANMKGGDFDSIFKSKFKLYKVKDGKNIIRILPPTWEGARHYGFDLWVNYNIGADNQSYLSLSKMKGEKDPLEEARKQAEREDDKDLAKALKPRQRILMWIIDRNNEDEGPQLFSCPFSLDKAIANKAFDEDSKDVILVDDPEEGCDVRFYKEGTGLKTDYPAEKIKFFEKSPLCDDEGLQKEWLDFIQDNPLPDVLQYHDYEHISNAFNGVVGGRDDDEDKPRRRKAVDDDESPRSKARNRVDDDEEEPPFETRKRSRVEDDDKPTRTRSRGEEVDEEEDDAEPETEKPKSSIRDRLRERRRPSEED